MPRRAKGRGGGGGGRGGGGGGGGGGGRRGPLSAKQRKEQLREKREAEKRRKEREWAAGDKYWDRSGWADKDFKDGAEHPVREPRPAPTSDDSDSDDGDGDGDGDGGDAAHSDDGDDGVGLVGGGPKELYFDPKQLKTVFVKEEKETVERRKIESQRPFERREGQREDDQCEYYREVLPMPARPPWERGEPKGAVLAREEAAFRAYLEHDIYGRYPRERLNFFEHNLEVWRQLWRTCERSDILLCMADCRHPLFNFPPSLYDYVTRVLGKPLVLVLNKTDLVPPGTVEKWRAWLARHFPRLLVTVFTSFPEAGASRPVVPSSERELGNRAALKLKPRLVPARNGVTVGTEELQRICQRIVDESDDLSRRLGRRPLTFFSTLRKGGPRDRGTREERMERRQKERLDKLKQLTKRPGVDLPRRRDLKRERRLAKRKERKEKKRLRAEKFAAAARAAPPRKERPAYGDEKEDGSGSGSSSEPDLMALAHGDDGGGDGSGSGSDSGSDSGSGGDSDSGSGSGSDSDDSDAEEEEENGGGGGKQKKKRTTVTLGLLGHPNAGKSSLINALCGKSVVSVSRSPGHTKHFQTIFLNDTVRLCDCPGLVFPALDMPRPLQVLCGLYPIAQVREPYSIVGFLAERVPLEVVYRLQPVDAERDTEEAAGDASAFEWPRHRWSAFELCQAFAKKKSYHSKSGGLDTHRAGNEILRDTLSGRVLLYFEPPTKPVQLMAGGALDDVAENDE